MTAPQRVDPARMRKAIRAQTIADVATYAIWAAVALMLAGLSTHLGYLDERWAVLAPVGVILLVLGGPVSLAGGQLADLYRQPSVNSEDER